MSESRPRAPRVMLVTDRRRLTSAVNVGTSHWPALLTAQIRGAVGGGADLIQVREPDLDAGTLVRFLRALFRDVPGSRDRVVVNDRADVALAAGAAGVHLRERSYGVHHIRALLPADKPVVIGRSVHRPESAAIRGASYFLAGTVARSDSKPAGTELLGWEGLRLLVTAAQGTPVLAIGGLTIEDVPQVRGAGATGLAAIGWFLPSAAVDLTEFVQARVAALRLAFDSEERLSYTEEAER